MNFVDCVTLQNIKILWGEMFIVSAYTWRPDKILPQHIYMYIGTYSYFTIFKKHGKVGAVLQRDFGKQTNLEKQNLM